MRNVRLFCALLLVAGAAACTGEPTSPDAGAPLNSAYIGSGYTTPDSTSAPADSTIKN